LGQSETVIATQNTSVPSTIKRIRSIR